MLCEQLSIEGNNVGDLNPTKNASIVANFSAVVELKLYVEF
jgi:hypothetical protein